jgi:transmembrane protein 17
MRSTRLSHTQSLSNLSLQMQLYYNFLFSVLYMIIIGSCAVYKALYYNKKVSVSVWTVWIFFEVIRLYYGFSGNLKEKVPELATYVLITIFPQIPFTLYFAYIQPVIFPVDPILGTFMLIFLCLQVYTGFTASRLQIGNQTAQFLREIGDRGPRD